MLKIQNLLKIANFFDPIIVHLTIYLYLCSKIFDPIHNMKQHHVIYWLRTCR